MQQKRVFTEMQRLGVEDGPSKIPVAAGIKRRTRHCMIRLLNVMFSETFAGRVHEIDGKPTRAELDSNQTHASSSFWTGFHDAYLSDQAEFGKLNSTLPLFAKCNQPLLYLMTQQNFVICGRTSVVDTILKCPFKHVFI
ncbi:hypothetical protein AM588_10003872 [Phytophthora nicotianae]|nr:hypothetical protein AM588_10003872 [Phytophthora nicotianae]